MASGVPIAASATSTEPLACRSVHSMLPGSSGVPSPRNQPGPYRAISARWASVSTFWTSVGRPSTPRSNTRGGVNCGTAGPPLTRLASADSSPARKRCGDQTISTGSRSSPYASRSGK